MPTGNDKTMRGPKNVSDQQHNVEADLPSTFWLGHGFAGSHINSLRHLFLLLVDTRLNTPKVCFWP